MTIEVTTTHSRLVFTYQDNPEARVAVHQAHTHPVPPLPLTFYQLAAFRLNKAHSPQPPITQQEVEQAVSWFNAASPRAGQVVEYKPEPDRWSR